MGFAVQLTNTFESITCFKCGVEFAVPAYWRTKRLDDHTNWFCPNGHEQHFTGESEAEKLRKRLEWKEAELGRMKGQIDSVCRSRDAYKGKLGALKERVKNGVCPCCKRSFSNLRRHIESKHPDYSKEPE